MMLLNKDPFPDDLPGLARLPENPDKGHRTAERGATFAPRLLRPEISR